FFPQNKQFSHIEKGPPLKLKRCTVTTQTLHHHDSNAAPSQLKRYTVTTFATQGIDEHRESLAKWRFIYFLFANGLFFQEISIFAN
ncbi:MAG: hypothetical protein II386_06055, partial [Bacteroidaceae bacterium]|nr:hypothetical protein [Bacteroidaceae bacterium]